MRREEIDGHTYLIPSLPAWEAFDIVNELTAVVGPLASAFKGALKGGASLDTMDISGIGEAITLALKALPAAERKHLVRILLKGVQVEVKTTADVRTPQVLSIFDEHFRGKIFSVFKVCAASAQENFADFYEAARSAFALGRARLAREKLPAPQSSPASE